MVRLVKVNTSWNVGFRHFMTALVWNFCCKNKDTKTSMIILKYSVHSCLLSQLALDGIVDSLCWLDGIVVSLCWLLVNLDSLRCISVLYWYICCRMSITWSIDTLWTQYNNIRYSQQYILMSRFPLQVGWVAKTSYIASFLLVRRSIYLMIMPELFNSKNYCHIYTIHTSYHFVSRLKEEFDIWVR